MQKDAVQAVKWYRKAAEQGHQKAQYNLALAYATGEGVRKNSVQAVLWFRKAAKQGHAKAENWLGKMYATGQGVPRNNAQARKWYQLAAAHDDADGRFNLQELISKKTQSTDFLAEAAVSKIETWKSFRSVFAGKKRTACPSILVADW